MTTTQSRKFQKRDKQCYAISFNNRVLWCNHKTFIKYSQGNAVGTYILMIYLQIKILYSERTFQSNPLLVTSWYNNYNTNFIYIFKNLQTNKGYLHNLHQHSQDIFLITGTKTTKLIPSLFLKKNLHFSVTNWWFLINIFHIIRK